MKEKKYIDIDKLYKQLNINNENRAVRTSINTGTIFNDDGKRGKDYCKAPQANIDLIYKMIK